MEITVLVVEDDPINMLVAQKLLEKSFIIYTASKANIALELISQQKFDIILMDINLGSDSIEGIELMQQIKNEEKENAPKIYAVTSYAMPEDKEKFLNFGFDWYFPKPISKEMIIEKIKLDLGQ